MISKKRVVFMYLYGLHQLYHSVVTAMEFSIKNPGIETILLSSNKDHTDALLKVKSYYPDANVKIIELPQPFRYKYLNIKKKIYPSVNVMIRRAKKYVINADVVVTTSHGMKKMFRKYKILKPKLVIMKHGAGDRKYSFDPTYGEYNLVLIGGEHHLRVMLEKEIVKKEQIKVIGYPKFDYPVDSEKVKSNLFKNTNPIILYNPHWHPKYSSYNKYAKFILEFFQKNNNYNLIFAPHILLYHWSVRYQFDIDLKSYSGDNIHIDFGSSYSTDNTYTTIGDVYIGDVSSLVYEWVALKPRPCIFLNANGAQWENNLYYRFWEMGYVINKKSEFKEVFTRSVKDNSFIQLQKNRIKEYIDITEVPSSKRAANAITEFLNNA